MRSITNAGFSWCRSWRLMIGTQGFSYRVYAKVVGYLILFDDSTNRNANPIRGLLTTKIMIHGRLTLQLSGRSKTILHYRCGGILFIYQWNIIHLYNHGLRLFWNLSPTLLRNVSLMYGLIYRGHSIWRALRNPNFLCLVLQIDGAIKRQLDRILLAASKCSGEFWLCLQFVSV